MQQDQPIGTKEEADVPAAADAARRSSPARGWGRIVAIILLFCVSAAALFCAGWFGHYFSLDRGLRTFMWALSETEKHYYEPIDKDGLYEDIIAALEERLDPYSCYYSSGEYAAVIRESCGENEGIGITMMQGEGTLVLYSVTQNSPADLAGLRRGMYILAYGADPASLTPYTQYEPFGEFLAAQTQPFYLRCGYAADGSDAEEFQVERREYHAAYVSYADSESSFSFRGEETLALTETGEALDGLDEDTAYIRLDAFNGNAAEEFRLCLVKMRERGRSDLILDLRWNGGGYMSTLSEIAGHLLRNAEGDAPLVARAKYRDGSTAEFHASANDFSAYFSADSRIRVLANEGTASASECLIGALIDYGTIGYGDICVRKDAQTGYAATYGKGIMQSHFMSLSGEVMKLTVATIHWPVSDRCIHGTGVGEADGAVAIVSPYIEGTDSFLQQVLG